MKQELLFPEYPETPRIENPNPCVRLHGFGPEGKKCRNCTHLFYHRMSKTYIKCNLRVFTHGPGSDHRAGWNACSKFEEITTLGEGSK